MFCWAVRLNGAWDRRGYAAVAVEHKLLVFGGLRGSNTAPMEVHVFNTVSLRWRKLAPVTAGRGERHLQVPSARERHTAVLIDDVIYIWGGLPHCDVVYAFDVDAHRWSKPRVSGTVPEARDDHSACVLGKVMFIHGGSIQKTLFTNDIYKFDTTTMVWSVINTRGSPPRASFCHSANIIGTKMFVFGGCGNGDYKNTVRVFDTERNLWLTAPSAQPHPVGRRSHSAFAYNGELYIFGGWNFNQDFNDLWKFNTETFSWKKVRPKGNCPSKDYGMCCCIVGDRIIFFGGNDKPNDLSVLDLSPSLKTLCNLAVIQYDLEQTGLPHNIRWELAARNTNGN